MENEFFEKNKNYILIGGIVLGISLMIFDLLFIGFLLISGSILYYFEFFKSNLFKKENKYINDNILPDENIIFLAKIHPIIFAIPSILLIITILIDNYIMYTLMSIFILLLFISATIDFYTTEFGITNKRIIKKTGWLKRDTVELNYAKIESLNVDQSILGRLFNYGTLNLTGTGGTKSSVNFIESPLDFRNAYINHITEKQEV